MSSSRAVVFPPIWHQGPTALDGCVCRGREPHGQCVFKRRRKGKQNNNKIKTYQTIACSPGVSPELAFSRGKGYNSLPRAPWCFPFYRLINAVTWGSARSLAELAGAEEGCGRSAVPAAFSFGFPLLSARCAASCPERAGSSKLPAGFGSGVVVLPC